MGNRERGEGMMTVSELRLLLEPLDGDMPVWTGGALGSGMGRATTVEVLGHDGKDICLVEREEP